MADDQKKPGFLADLFAPVGGFGVTFATMFRKLETEEYPEEKRPTAAAVPRPPPAQPAPGRAREVRRLRAVRVGLPGRRDPRRGRLERRQRGRHRPVLARRALRPRLPDQLPALHLLRPVHRGLPDAGPDDDQLLRAGRQQPRRPHLHQGAAARPAPGGHAPGAAPDGRRASRSATTTRARSPGRRREQEEWVKAARRPAPQDGDGAAAATRLEGVDTVTHGVVQAGA